MGYDSPYCIFHRLGGPITTTLPVLAGWVLLFTGVMMVLGRLMIPRAYQSVPTQPRGLCIREVLVFLCGISGE